MTTTLEDQLRSTLRTHARDFSPRGSETDVRRRVQRRRRRRQLVPAVGAAAAITAAIVVVARQGDDTDRTSVAAQAPDGGATLGARTDRDPRVQVVLPGWTTTHLFTFGTEEHTADDLADPTKAASLVGVEYQFVRPGQRLQLHIYSGGKKMYDARTGGDPRSTVRAFGRDASLLDYDEHNGRGGRYRLDVLVGDHTWEFDGAPFVSAEDFLAAIESLRLVSHEDWLASLASAEASHVVTDGGPDAEPVPDTATADHAPVGSAISAPPPPGDR